MQAMDWQISSTQRIPLDRPRLIGIVNITPDSFDAQTRSPTTDAAIERARSLVGDGADILDLGAQSTRPGAASVPAEVQIARMEPLVRALRGDRGFDHVALSIDTTSAEVARRMLDLGADIINDVSAGLDDDRMLGLCARRRCGLVLMHRLAPPEQDSYSDRYERAPRYDDVVEDVRTFLAMRMRAAMDAGVCAEAIVLDPGLGFGKSVEQNFALIRGTPRLASLGRPILSALSRKSFIGRVGLERDSEPGERVSGTIAASLAHMQMGVRLFRVHDVRAHASAFRIARACGTGESPDGSRTRPGTAAG